MAQRLSAMAQGESGKGADADGKNHNHIHPEALHLAKRPTAGASGDNPGDSAPAVDSERCQTPRYLGVAPHYVWSQDWLLAHATWATRLFWFSFIFQAVAALVARPYPSHILMYAPGDAPAYRLATSRTILENSDSLLFVFPLRWLSSLTPVTYLCMLLGIRCVAALRQNEMLEYRFSAISGFHVLRLKYYKIVRQMARSAHRSGTYS